jgi:hypothetical protein
MFFPCCSGSHTPTRVTRNTSLYTLALVKLERDGELRAPDTRVSPARHTFIYVQVLRILGQETVLLSEIIVKEPDFTSSRNSSPGLVNSMSKTIKLIIIIQESKYASLQLLNG